MVWLLYTDILAVLEQILSKNNTSSQNLQNLRHCWVFSDNFSIETWKETKETQKFAKLFGKQINDQKTHLLFFPYTFPYIFHYFLLGSQANVYKKKYYYF